MKEAKRFREQEQTQVQSIVSDLDLVLLWFVHYLVNLDSNLMRMAVESVNAKNLVRTFTVLLITFAVPFSLTVTINIVLISPSVYPMFVLEGIL